VGLRFLLLFLLGLIDFMSQHALSEFALIVPVGGRAAVLLLICTLILTVLKYDIEIKLHRYSPTLQPSKNLIRLLSLQLMAFSHPQQLIVTRPSRHLLHINRVAHIADFIKVLIAPIPSTLYPFLLLGPSLLLDKSIWHGMVTSPRPELFSNLVLDYFCGVFWQDLEPSHIIKL
jgi:hypothetical protein